MLLNDYHVMPSLLVHKNMLILQFFFFLSFVKDNNRALRF